MRMHVGRGRRAGLRFDAELGVTTEALVFLGQLDPEAIGPSLADATHYEPTPPADFDTLLAAVPFGPENTSFVDLGCGMGRTLLLAATRPFKQITGIEISPALAEIARDNLKAADAAAHLCRDIRVVTRDAKTAKLPPGDLVVYMYNPFRGAVMQAVVDRLAARTCGELAVVYHTPEERARFEESGAFETVAEIASGVVYRRIAGDQTPTDVQRSNASRSVAVQ
jgi:SAM-dependent methyltransferase